jgi:hypothetical protein
MLLQTRALLVVACALIPMTRIAAADEVTAVQATTNPDSPVTRRDTGATVSNANTDRQKKDSTKALLPANTVAQNKDSTEQKIAPEVYEQGFKAIFLLLVLAVVLESALAVLFNWRPFVETFNARAVRPLVSFIVALVFVNWFDLDLVTTLVNASTTTIDYKPALPGLVLTALVIAGGSAGVNNLLVALGYRQRRTPETVAPKPPHTEAWIAVRLHRTPATTGPVLVFIGVPPGPAPALPPLVGIITGSSRPGLRYFLNDPGRYPGYGGHAVPANTAITVRIHRQDNADAYKSWGPYVIGGGAIVDLELTL